MQIAASIFNLCLLLFLLSLRSLNAQSQIAISSYYPVSNCTQNVTYSLSSGQYPLNPNSYMHEFISYLLKYTSYSANSNSITFVCLFYNQTFTTNLSNLWFYASPIPMLPNYTQYGIFSSSFLSSKMVLVTQEQPILTQRPSFLFEGFQIELWAFIFGMIVVVSHFLWFFERSDDLKFPLSYLPGISEALWHTLLYFFRLSSKGVRSLPGRFIVALYLFISYILTVYIMASFIGRLTYLQQFPFGQTNTTFVTNSRFGMFDDIQSIVKKRLPNMSYTAYSRSQDSVNSMFSDLQNGNLDFLIIDEFSAYNTIGTSCSLHLEDYGLFSLNYALLFPNGTSQATIQQVNAAIASMNQQGVLQKLQYKYFNLYDPGNCFTITIDNSRIFIIWIVVILGLSISVVSHFGQYLLRKKFKSEEYINEVIHTKQEDQIDVRKGFKNLLRLQRKKSKNVLIKHFDKILMEYEDKHKETLRKLRDVLVTKEDIQSELYLFLKEMHLKANKTPNLQLQQRFKKEN